MPRVILRLTVCQILFLSLGCDNIGQSPRALPQTPQPIPTDDSAKPSADNVKAIADSLAILKNSGIQNFNVVSHSTDDKLSIQQFRDMLERARPIADNDAILQEWHYSPWCTATFKGPSGQYKLSLMLGGLGTLHTPNGKRGVILIDGPPTSRGRKRRCA